MAGAGSLNRETLHGLLEDDGYRWLDEALFNYGRVAYLVEFYRRRDAGNDVREAARQIVNENRDLMEVLEKV
jgi:hypothetical protein